ncbi:LOW QUALITY PROTEIN: hypothetical protein PanWU01x14_021990, partial [Parasponia andersonii]
IFFSRIVERGVHSFICEKRLFLSLKLSVTHYVVEEYNKNSHRPLNYYNKSIVYNNT